MIYLSSRNCSQIVCAAELHSNTARVSEDEYASFLHLCVRESITHSDASLGLLAQAFSEPGECVRVYVCEHFAVWHLVSVRVYDINNGDLPLKCECDEGNILVCTHTHTQDWLRLHA
jgi:hypothetical protein